MNAAASRGTALVKLAKAARLSAEAAKLYLEAAEELTAQAADPTRPTDLPPVTEFDAARARRALRRVGAKVR